MNSDYQDLPFAITLIDTHYTRPQMAAAYLLTANGRAAFIETGPLLAAERLLTALARVGLKSSDVDAIIVSHVHLDHAGGAGELLRLCPEARLYVQESGAKHLIDPAKLKASAMTVYGEELFLQTLGDIVPAPQERVVTPTDGDVLVVGDRELHFIHTPGHARHHMCVWDPTSRGLFSGDAFGISYRDFDSGDMAYIFPATTPVQLDPEAFHSSFERLAALKPDYLYLTHFGAIAYRPEFLQSLHLQLDQYVAMARKARIQNVSDHQQLLADLREHTIAALKELNFPGNMETVDTILLADREINAQGLEVWLARLEKHRGT